MTALFDINSPWAEILRPPCIHCDLGQVAEILDFLICKTGILIILISNDFYKD